MGNGAKIKRDRTLTACPDRSGEAPNTKGMGKKIVGESAIITGEKDPCQETKLGTENPWRWGGRNGFESQ